MWHLANSELDLELIDPVCDYSRLGWRYCAGGYIWQISDRRVGPLLTGPEWPHLNPAPHNGQGLPESFRHSTTTGEPLLWKGNVGLAPGGGALARDAAGTVIITAPCVWRVEFASNQVRFHTEQTVNGWSYSLTRDIELVGRTVRSRSTLTNHGASTLALEWFAHPFFALQADGLVHVTLPEGTTISDNPGYTLAGRELTLRRAFVGVHDGHLEHLGLPAGQCFAATLSHPKIDGVTFTTDFAPFKCVLWANGNTLSLEPFLRLDLLPGETRRWSLSYDFGRSAERSGDPR